MSYQKIATAKIDGEIVTDHLFHGPTWNFGLKRYMNSENGNNIEFEVKSNFDVIANVTSESTNGSIVNSFNVTSTIDLSDKIDNVDNITDLQVIGVSLQLMDYHPHSPGQNGALDHYYLNTVKGDLKVTLLSNSAQKVLYEGNVDLGTNNRNSYGLTQTAPIIELPIEATQAKDLVENKIIKLRIEFSNTEIRDDSFKIKIVAKTEAITEV